MTPLVASISDATIWSVTFDDTRSVDYDRNSFVIQATELMHLAKSSKEVLNLHLYTYNLNVAGIYPTLSTEELVRRIKL
jgi:hypothetical protein